MQTVSQTRVGSLDPHGEAGEVNPNYLQHLLAVAAQHDVRAGADIAESTGLKLVLMGTRIEAAKHRDDLLASRLARPLENWVEIKDGVSAARVQETAKALLEEFPLIALIDATDADEPLLDVVAKLRLTPPLQALLTVYAAQGATRLKHAVGVSLLTAAMARKLLPGKPGLHRQLALAGLMHDVGELYVEPLFQDKSKELEAEQWRQIASHPVIGSRVLSAMEGAGPVVADAVMAHHERMDGFGYPRGLSDTQFVPPLQILAKSEWLMGLMEAGTGPLMRASIAAKLIPGEFSQPVSLLVYMATRSSSEMAAWLESQQVTEDVNRQVTHIVAMLVRFREIQVWVDAVLSKAGPELRAVLDCGVRRLKRIQAAFTGAGLDAISPGTLLASLEGQAEQRERQELIGMIGEFSWRMREIERTCLMRGSLMSQGEATVMRKFVGKLRGDPA